MYDVDEKYIDFIHTILMGIENELRRLYWNKNQEEIESPFRNTGNSYSNSVFTVRSYDWNTEDKGEDILPNFEYKGFKLWWYKYAGRGMYAKCNEIVNAEYLYQMHEDCIKALKGDLECLAEAEQNSIAVAILTVKRNILR